MAEPIDSLDIRTKPPCHREDALAVVHRLRDAGHIAYFAGGCVRDLLLGLEPKDYDVATDAPPNRVQQLFSSTQAVGQAFGVILVRHRGSIIEVATFRSEGPYLDGRHPASVHFATPQQDAQRRDFTINGLFLDPVENKVIDYVAGQNDLKARLLRAIGQPDQRFEEDHLRLLRAIRFASRFNLTIEDRTADAIRRHAPRLVRISPERIADELRLMLTPPTRTRAWPMLWQFTLIDPIFRFLPPVGSAPRTSSDAAARNADPTTCGAGLQPASQKQAEGVHHNDSVVLSLSSARPISFGLALAAACLDWRLQGTDHTKDLRPLLTHREILAYIRAMRQALRISNDESEELSEILESIAPLLSEAEPTLARKRRFLAKPTATSSRLLLDAIAATHRHTQRIDSLQREFAVLETQDNAPVPLITGDDLTSAGLSPGPLFKRLLDAVYDAQLENRVTTKEQALAMALGAAGVE